MANKFRINFKKIGIFFVLFCMIFTLSMPINAIAATEASDISNHWAQDTIQSWLDKGFIAGYPDGSFKPDINVSRAEFMTMVNKAFDYKGTAAINYSDVKAGAWYADAIKAAKAAGYISGYPDGTMKPDKSISREEACIIIMKINKLEANAQEANTFSDAGRLTWSKGAVGAVAEAGIMKGYPDGSFGPQKMIKRGECAVSLDRAEKYTAEPVIPAEEVTFTGYIQDQDCFIQYAPDYGDDTKMCLSMESCAASGYGITALQKDGTYKFYYFDGSFAALAPFKVGTGAQSAAWNLIKNTSKTKDVTISVTGTLSGKTKVSPYDGLTYPVLTVSSLTETN